jgi:hypothetical protein
MRSKRESASLSLWRWWSAGGLLLRVITLYSLLSTLYSLLSFSLSLSLSLSLSVCVWGGVVFCFGWVNPFTERSEARNAGVDW